MKTQPSAGLLALVVAFAPFAARAQAPAPSVRPQPGAQRDAKQALSKEDEALVKDLVLLERVELLRNLELFEGGAEPASTPPPPPAPAPRR